MFHDSFLTHRIEGGVFKCLDLADENSQRFSYCDKKLKMENHTVVSRVFWFLLNIEIKIKFSYPGKFIQHKLKLPALLL